MSVTWTHVWAVAHGGESFMEKEASNFDALEGDITLRPVGATTRQGWQRYSRPNVVQRWATTPEEAIDKYLALHHALVGNLEASIAVARLSIANVEKLRERL